MLRLLDEEFLGCAIVLEARLYYDAFQIAITHNDQARASVFAGRAYDARMVCEGDDSPETRRMKDFRTNPDSHRNFGASKRWRTRKSAVPKGLSGYEFEDWLWRSH
ncbi:hypothetical protein G6011_09093 [Alternaria panax]|uniref:Uncharacterized protein n=1 Tax=Alternaria panax TaxID=48097 RepID=A0AAD4NQQ8_9PLEO|nr:hypothetical protein G6011_09093 [Alternaria panax]